ncbi:MAG: tetratricopeptide repeat protein [candidate division KSB1 bacterium]|nr:tetratricopeptide repeat protein [candidate division KSB1 bacterium]
MVLLLGLLRSTAVAQDLPQKKENTEKRYLEAISLFGDPLYRITFSPAQEAKLTAQLKEAQKRYEANPDDPDALIWYGRRLAYLWRYREAVQVFSGGIKQFPNDARMYRHRGHRYITLRQFDRAIADLEKAAKLIQGQNDEIEPDGQPNKYNIPRSTLHSNIWYHLGLAYYLKGDFDKALRAYRECLKVSRNDDMLCATVDWLYMTLRRMGREEEARASLELIREDMEILENTAYHRRLLMYKGLLSPDSLLNWQNASELDMATYGYGLGNWYYYNGNKKRAREIFEKVVAGRFWPAFGYIAAEADLRRWRR